MSFEEQVSGTAAALKVVRGAPDDMELAALVAGMVAMAAAQHDAEDPGSPTSAWMDRSRTMRGARTGPLGKGENAWRHSLR